MKKKMLGLLLAAMVVSSVPAFAAAHHNTLHNSAQNQELCYGGYYGEGGYGYCGRGYRGGYGQNQ